MSKRRREKRKHLRARNADRSGRAGDEARQELASQDRAPSDEASSDEARPGDARPDEKAPDEQREGHEHPDQTAASVAQTSESIQSVGDWAMDLLGADPGEIQGVLQTAAVWRRSGTGELVVLRIGETSPKSDSDRLLLQLGRARSQAIITTGKILRDEPELDYMLGFETESLPSSRSSLETWRRESCGLKEPPKLVVLSSGRGLPLHHPALEGMDVVVLTGPEGAQSLSSTARAFGIDVEAQKEPSLRAAVEWLQGQGIDRVTIETGPSTSLALYDDKSLVDALSLSTFQGSEVPSEVAGANFLSGDRLHSLLQPVKEASTVNEADGPWGFQLWSRP